MPVADKTTRAPQSSASPAKAAKSKPATGGWLD